MERNGAMSYLKELLGTDIGISPDSVSIEPQQDRVVKIRIKTQDRVSIRDIAKKRGLKVSEEGESVVIYEP
ncbi:MAG: hypothetical protein WC203_07485 [Candidatus Bathyarchaeia archaeon]|jgi:DNA-directed RNA polymerase subunit L|nr:hypothetical protein [Thermoproteota archaeon]NLD66319.1 hypothetical protein [Thermoproteota archaeon]